MPAQKTTTLNLRVDPAIKEALREAAQRENRSIANMIEVLIRRHCRGRGDCDSRGVAILALIRLCLKRKYIVVMCGRFTLHTPEMRLREVFHLEHTATLGLKPRYNIAPSQQVPIIRNTDADREMVMAKWGLVPHWSKEPKTKYSTINARIETVAEKPVYRTPFKHRRCLIPADGFYEWKVVDGRKSTPSHPHEGWGCVRPRRPVGSLGRRR